MHRLRYESRERMYGLLGVCEPVSTSVGRWRVHEVYEPHKHTQVKKGLGAYHVVLETDVSSHEELMALHAEAVDFLENFEPAWLYVWGTPLNGSGWGVHLEVLGPPNGWSTNYSELDRALHVGRYGLFATIEIQSRQWRFGRYLPLEHALRVKENIARSAEALKALVRFHYQAHAASTLEASTFFLCKGLEIGRELLRGRSNHQKQRELPENVQAYLRYSLHEICRMANTHLETRHALRKGRLLSLHQPLGSDLIKLAKDIDLILRTVTCIEFEEEPVLIARDGELAV